MTITEIINKIIAIDPTYKEKQGKLYAKKKDKLINILKKLQKEASNERVQDRSGAKLGKPY